MGRFILAALAGGLLFGLWWIADDYLTPLVLVLGDGARSAGWGILAAALWPVAAALAALAVAGLALLTSYRHDVELAALRELAPRDIRELLDDVDRLRGSLGGRRRRARSSSIAARLRLWRAGAHLRAARRAQLPDDWQPPEARPLARLIELTAARETRLAGEQGRLDERRRELIEDARRHRIQRPRPTRNDA